MFTLIYSAQAAQKFGYNTARTTSGEMVQYTMMTDEVAHGSWETFYKWEDAKVVGGCESYDDIISYHPLQRGLRLA